MTSRKRVKASAPRKAKAGQARDLTGETTGPLAAASLAVSEVIVSTLLDLTRDGVAMADATTGLLIDCNQALCRMLERDRTELLGQPQAILHSPASLIDGESPSFLQHRGGHSDRPLEDVLLSKSGKSIPVEILANEVEIGGRACLLGVFRDITERKRAEEERERSRQSYRALVVKLAQSEEIERHRLARELHDDVGQQLTALGLSLTALHGDLQQCSDATCQAKTRLDDLLELVRQVTERVRDIMGELRPPELDDYGLPAALRWFGERFTVRTDLAVEIRCDGPDRRLPLDTELALFRVAQEALTNVAKHAKANRVIVTLGTVGPLTRLTIEDDGVGFDVPVSGALAPSHWGLVNMEERVAAVGGRLRVISVPDAGTRVVVEVAGS